MVNKPNFVVKIFSGVIILLLSKSYLFNIAILLLIEFIYYNILVAPIYIIYPSCYFILLVNDLPSFITLLYHRYSMSKLFIFLSSHYFSVFIIPLLNEEFEADLLLLLELLRLELLAVKHYYDNVGNLFNIVLTV